MEVLGQTAEKAIVLMQELLRVEDFERILTLLNLLHLLANSTEYNLLENEGYSVQHCTDGEKGLRAYKPETFDLCILDVMMPKMNGMEVCRKVKNELMLEQVYIVLLTAKGQEVDRLKGQEVGADIYLTKPFDPETLLEKAKTVLGI